MTALENLHTSSWEGYQRTDFLLDERQGLLVHPQTPLPGCPWVWRAEFFGAFDYADRALLKKGWHIAYYRISNMYGCPEAVALMKSFHNAMVKRFSLNGRAALFGFSRGGLYAVNFAAAYPEDVLLLYLDAPVLDIRSWPGGLGQGPGASKEWADCKRWYRLTEDTARSFRHNPLDQIPQLTAARIPVLLVAGEADTLVPYSENGAILHREYTRHGGCIHTILKPGVDHHPHSLEDPTPIVAFIEEIYRRSQSH